MKTINYPLTKKGNVTDNYFGKEIKDSFRWLEDDLSSETKDWVKTQNNLSSAYLSNLPIRESVHKRLSHLWNFEKRSIPFKKGDFLYYFKNNGLQNQNVLYRKNENEIEEEFLNPNLFSEKGTDSLGIFKFSKNNKYLAYKISEGGSDWGRIVVMEVESKTIIEENVLDVKFSDIAWQGDEGFYYSTYKQEGGSKLSAKTDRHFVFYHKLFTAQENDEVIFGDKEKYRYVYASMTQNGRFMALYAANDSSCNKLFCKDLLIDSDFKTIIDDDKTTAYVLDSDGDDLILMTNKDAENSKVVKVNFSNPSSENWKDIIPEDISIDTVSTVGAYLFVNYIKDIRSLVKQFDYNGNFIREVKMDKSGSINGFNGDKEDKEVYFQFTNNTTPNSIYSFDIEKGKSKLFWEPKVDFEIEKYESKQVFYKSKDGTSIPMTISHKKGLKLNSDTPTILYGYGGFNASLKPFFSVINSVWLEMGGVYAVANIRGGGEYGRAWHDAGIKLKKQNVFDDFIAAAEYLIAEKYTSSKHLAIKGGSNGGLLVGAVMLQRPDLFQVALPAVGVLDMLRYHKFTSGAGWSYDYGTADDNNEMFEYLLKYSPLHNVKEGVEYPATLITTGDHDDRVVPAHSFKFAAELQSKCSGINPKLIRVETDAGHGAGMSVDKMINLSSDVLSFTWNHLNEKE